MMDSKMIEEPVVRQNAAGRSATISALQKIKRYCRAAMIENLAAEEPELIWLPKYGTLKKYELYGPRREARGPPIQCDPSSPSIQSFYHPNHSPES